MAAPKSRFMGTGGPPVTRSAPKGARAEPFAPDCSNRALPRLPERLLLRPLEIARVRRRLVLARRHQVAVRTDEIGLAADDDVLVVLVAIVLGPSRIALPFVAARHR